MQTLTLKNANGMRMDVCNLGGIVTTLTAPDVRGKYEDIVLAVENPAKNAEYLGVLAGRVANRIAQGKFKVDGRTYALFQNDATNTLHGGKRGIDKREWTLRKLASPDGAAAELTLLSPDGEEGFPGNLFIRVVYTLTHNDTWRIDYWAMTDAPTPVNLTQHAYFNLSACRRDILDHELQLFCDAYTPTDKKLIPTGEVAKVKGTPMDFTVPIPIGKRIDAPFTALRYAGGYDHNYVINKFPSRGGVPEGTESRGRGGLLSPCARVRDPESGRVMEMWTTEPCVQFYAGNFLNGSLVGKKKVRYTKRFGFCLEAQEVPNAINRPVFGDTVLRPGDVYRQTTEYRFSAE